jgi:hypothetical protein
MTIEPNIGDIVWYSEIPHPSDLHTARHFEQPHAAMIVFVHQDGTVNLTQFSPDGVPVPVIRVTLLQDGDDRPLAGGFAMWPKQKDKQPEGSGFRQQIGEQGRTPPQSSGIGRRG